MGNSPITLIAILVLAIITIRRRPDKETASHRQAKWLLRLALFLMDIYALYWLYFGISEMASGEPGGVIHLLPAISLFVLMALTWRHPLEGGIVLVIQGLLAPVYYGVATMPGGGRSKLHL